MHAARPLRAFFCTAWAAFAALPAAAEVSERESLAGLQGVLLVVEDLHADARQIELTRHAIVEDVEARLRDAGIEVMTLQERLGDPRKPYLYINCNVIYVPDIELVSFSIDVESHQLVTLKNGDEAIGLTWAKSYLGVQGKRRAAQKIKDETARLVDLFIADFLSVNRQSSPGPGSDL